MRERKAIARKCRCHSVWCAQCFVAGQAKKHMEKLRAFDWRRTREIVVTCDPKQFKDGKEAYEYVQEHKEIAGLIRNLRRGCKEQDPKTGEWRQKFKANLITKWMWFMEWHKSGFPHWHIFIEVAERGQAGMIDANQVRYYWKAGTWVYATYIKSERHFKHLTGYFAKMGYFELTGKHGKLKEHQMRLPKWAMMETKTIRRSGSMVQKKEKKKATLYDLCEYFDRKGREIRETRTETGDVVDIRTGEIIREKRARRTYEAIITECGTRTRVALISEKSFLDMTLDIPYRKIRKMDGEYIEGRGYVVRVSTETLKGWMEKIHKVNFYKGENTFVEERMRAWENEYISKGPEIYWKTYLKREANA